MSYFVFFANHTDTDTDTDTYTGTRPVPAGGMGVWDRSPLHHHLVAL